MEGYLQKAKEYCLQKTRENCKEFTTCFPTSQSKDYWYGKTACTDWTESFWTGILWLSYEMTDEKIFVDTARAQLPLFTTRIQERMLMYGKVSQENYVELTAASAIPNKEIKSPQILRY